MKYIKKDEQIFISDYGMRHCFSGMTKCGSKPPENFLHIPKHPTLAHAAAKLLWAISLACTVKQDRVTRRETVKICELARNGKIDSPCVRTIGGLFHTAQIQGYWRDLYRRGYIRQYRRTYASWRHEHSTVVYELTLLGQQFLSDARNNTMGNWDAEEYPTMLFT